jgi:hypothetical protein
MVRTRGFGAPSPPRRGWLRQIPPPLRLDDARRTTLLELSFPLWSTHRGRPLAKGRRSRLRPRRGVSAKKTRYVDGVSTPVVRALSICTPFLLSFLDLLELVILFPSRVPDRSCHPCTGGSQEISLTMVLILNRNNTLEEKLYVFLLS